MNSRKSVLYGKFYVKQGDIYFIRLLHEQLK